MSITLSPELEKLVRDRVETGRYASSNEVVEEALRLPEARERDEAEKLEALRRDIRVGRESVPVRPFDAADLKRRLRAGSTRD